MKSAISVSIGFVHFAAAFASLLFLFGWAFTDSRFGARAAAPVLPLFGFGFCVIAIPGSSLATNLIAYLSGIAVAHLVLFIVYANAVGPGSEFPLLLTLCSVIYFLALGAGETLASHLINRRKNEN